MEKIKSFILSIDFNVLIFVLVGLRITFFGASIGDALAITALCGLKAFIRWSEDRKIEPLDEKVAKELEEIKAHISGLSIKNSIRPPVSPGADQMPRKFF